MTETLSKANAKALRIYRMIERGASVAQAAKELRCTLQWVHIMKARGRRVAEDIHRKSPALELSERSRNALEKEGCDVHRPETVAAHITSMEELKRVPNIGVKCIKEINQWLTKHGQEPIT